MGIIERITRDEIINAAYDWLCTRRRDYHFNNDVWQLGLQEFKIQNSKLKMSEVSPITDRTFDFTVRIVNLCKVLD